MGKAEPDPIPEPVKPSPIEPRAGNAGGTMPNLGGFDHDDHIQQAIAVTVLVAAGLIGVVFGATSRLTSLLAFGSVGLALAWYLAGAKGILDPFGFIRGYRDIFRYLRGKRS